jgi:glycosyltransferase involved in cell wall biosynthesis
MEDSALRLNPAVRDTLASHMIMLDKVRRRVDEFDILHFHIELLHARLVREFADRTLTTLHGRLDLPDLIPFYASFSDLPLAPISNHQQGYLRNVNWMGTVYHGLPGDLLPSPKAAGYLAFIGRIAPEKRPDHAIEIATRSSMPLKIAAKIDRAHQAYWDEKIRPMVEANSEVEFMGEIGESEKAGFLGGAAALLFPIDWPEPFGLVMIEAMACGTPVIAYRRGSVPEIIQNNGSGFVVDTIEEAITAVRRHAHCPQARTALVYSSVSNSQVLVSISFETWTFSQQDAEPSPRSDPIAPVPASKLPPHAFQAAKCANYFSHAGYAPI